MTVVQVPRAGSGKSADARALSTSRNRADCGPSRGADSYTLGGSHVPPVTCILCGSPVMGAVTYNREAGGSCTKEQPGRDHGS